MGVQDRFHLQDETLADQARDGSRGAFEELYRRLAPTAWRLALAVTRDPALAAGAVASGFASTLSRPPAATNTTVRSQLLAATRHAAFEPDLEAVAVACGPIGSSAPTAARTAFASVPERWRSSLWLTEVEGLEAAEVGPALGLPAASVTPLVTRARLGLGEQVVTAHAAEAPVECQDALDRLVDYGADRLAPREANRVRRHLDGCDSCQGLLADLDDVVPSVRRLALPLPVELFDVSERRWRNGLVHAPGPLGLTLPSGRPVPAWAERAVAGAAAAVIALGITSAILVAGRGGRVRDDDLARSVAEGEPLGDGESAAGGDVGLDDDLLGATTPTLAPAAPAANGSLSRTVQRTVASAPVPTPAPAPAVAPVAPVAPVTPEPEPAPPPAVAPPATPSPPATEPAVEVTVGVEGVLGLTVGDQCAGLELAGTTLGCAPATTGAPLEVITGGTLLDALGL